MSEPIHEALAVAARNALRAPSVLNTQPWQQRLMRWHDRPEWSGDHVPRRPAGEVIIGLSDQVLR